MQPSKRNILLLLLLCTIVAYLIIAASKHKTSETSRAVFYTPNPTSDTIDYHPEDQGHEVAGERIKIASSTAWLAPSKSFTIYPNNTKPSDDVAKKITEAWQSNPQLKAMLDNAKINKGEHDYLYSQGSVPSLVGSANFTNKPEKFDYTISGGVGCGSCETIYIDIFINNDIYALATNEGTLIPNENGRGFYISDFRFGDQPATAQVDNIRIEKFQWADNKFIEVGEKSVWILPN